MKLNQCGNKAFHFKPVTCDGIKLRNVLVGAEKPDNFNHGSRPRWEEPRPPGYKACILPFETQKCGTIEHVTCYRSFHKTEMRKRSKFTEVTSGACHVSSTSFTFFYLYPNDTNRNTLYIEFKSCEDEKVYELYNNQRKG
jgi:hypothetical protein